MSNVNAFADFVKRKSELKLLDQKTLIAFYRFQKQHQKSPTIKEIAKVISYSEPSVFQAFGRLKLMGYLQQPDPFTWRGYYITEAGKTLTQQLGAGQ